MSLTPLSLEGALASHRPADEKEHRDLAEVRWFVSRHSDPFDRAIREGHLTGSAVVLCESGERVLLLHHRKLQLWLQPGGHAEPGESSGEQVALREALEETGIPGLRLHPSAPRPLDVDVHRIPARGDQSAHDHLDLRYLVLAPRKASPRLAEEESSDLRFFGWDQLEPLGLDHGLKRALAKARRVFSGQ